MPDPQPTPITPEAIAAAVENGSWNVFAIADQLGVPHSSELLRSTLRAMAVSGYLTRTDSGHHLDDGRPVAAFTPGRPLGPAGRPGGQQPHGRDTDPADPGSDYTPMGVSPSQATPPPTGRPTTPGSPRPAKTADRLKIAGRIKLDDGEILTGSGKYAGDEGNVRWATLARPDGSPRIRLGVGDAIFGTSDDECGPWTAGPDETEKINTGRRALRAERERIDARLEEINAANTITEAGAGTLADLLTERDRVRARLDEISECDMKVNNARGRQQAGEHVDPAELDPPPYCTPGEFNTLIARWRQLRVAGINPSAWGGGDPRPAQPGEYDTLCARYDELDKADLSDVGPSGFTAELDPVAVEQMAADLSAAVERADTKCREMNAWWDEHDRLDQAGDQAALAAYRATEPDTDGTFTEGRFPGEWGDLAYDVDVDDCEVTIHVGVIPHDSERFTSLGDLNGWGACCMLDVPEARKLAATLGRTARPVS